MDLKPVKSSHLNGVAHDADTNTLTVQFNDGSVFEYDGVTLDHFNELMAAKSIGKHFFATVKSVFDGRRVREWES